MTVRDIISSTYEDSINVHEWWTDDDLVYFDQYLLKDVELSTKILADLVMMTDNESCLFIVVQ